MVSIKHKFTYLEEGDIDLESWLIKIKHDYHLNNTDGQHCIEQGLEMA
jgi:hypothetical protein